MSKYLKPKAKKGLSAFSTVLLLILVLAVGLSAFVWAKYVSQEKKDTVIASQMFYFESDLLTEDGASYTLTPGTTSITVQLKNHIDDLRYSEGNISYVVTLTGPKNDSASGIMAAGDSNTSSVAIVFDDLGAGTYEVVAQATSPYSKTLKATFEIPASVGGVGYSVSDAANSPVVRVTVWTTDYSGDVTIGWPTGTYPDNTDPKLADATGNTTTVAFNNYSEYTFLFFKSDPTAVYNEDNFTVN